MYIHNDDTQNYPFYRLKLVVETLGRPFFLKAKDKKDINLFQYFKLYNIDHKHNHKQTNII